MDLRRTAALGAALLTLALLAAAPAQAREIGGCRVPESATVEAVGGRLVVWSGAKRLDRYGDWSRRVVACRRSTGRRVLVIEPYSDYETFDAYQFVVAGRFVAYVDAYYGRGNFESIVVREPFARPRTVAGNDLLSDQFTSEFPFGPRGDNDVIAMGLTREGTVAYVVRNAAGTDASGRAQAPVELRAVGRKGRRVLDAGEGIDPASLRVEGSTVHWTNAGVARSAPLPAPPARRR